MKHMEPTPTGESLVKIRKQEESFSNELDMLSLEVENFQPDETLGGVRYSSDPQGKGSTITRQKQRISEICERLGWPAPRWLIDEGVSAWSRDAASGQLKNMTAGTALGDFMAEVARGDYRAKTILLVYENCDRFSRGDLDDADSALMKLLRAGISVYFCNLNMLLRPRDRHHPIKRLILMLEFHRAHMESQRKSGLVRDSWAARIARARKGEQVNFGGIAPGWVTWDNKLQQYLPRADVLSEIQRIALDAINHKVLNQLVGDLNRSKVKMLGGGKRWTSQGVKAILTNPALMGTLVVGTRLANGKRDEAEILNFFPPVVSPEQFALLRARFCVKQPRAGGAGTGKLINNLFPGLVSCAECGHTMSVRQSPSGFHGRAYTCVGGEGGASECSRTRLYVDALELDLFLGVLNKAPGQFMLQRNEALQLELAQLQNRIAKSEQDVNAFGKLAQAAPTEAIIEVARVKYEELEALKRELAERMRSIELGSTVTSSWHLLRRELKLPILTDEALTAAKAAGTALFGELSDQTLRARIIGPLKHMIERIEVRANGILAWRLKLRGGNYSAWRNITALNAELKRRRMARTGRNLIQGRGPKSEETRLKISATKMRQHRVPDRQERERIAKALRASLAEKIKQKLAAGWRPVDKDTVRKYRKWGLI